MTRPSTHQIANVQEENAEWLDDVRDQLGLASASIVGISLGGWLALENEGHILPRQTARIEEFLEAALLAGRRGQLRDPDIAGHRPDLEGDAVAFR